MELEERVSVSAAFPSENRAGEQVSPILVTVTGIQFAVMYSDS